MLPVQPTPSHRDTMKIWDLAFFAKTACLSPRVTPLNIDKIPTRPPQAASTSSRGRAGLLFICTLALSIGTGLAAAPAAAPIDVEIGTLHGKMKYDKESFTVTPGSAVRLTFRNTDEMQHNWLLCRPGKNMALTIAQKAWTMGPQAMEKQFAPNDTNVLVHTRVLNPQENQTISFTAPSEPGDYPYVCTLPGHAFSMRGIMKVASKDPEPTLRDVVYLYYEIPRQVQMPNFDTLKPLRIKPITSNLLDLAAVQARAENFAVQFLAELETTTPGNYTFTLVSDDGTKLFVDDRLVVDNDGHHGMIEKEGSTILSAGIHQLRLQYFQADGGSGMRAFWKGPQFTRRPLSPTANKEREIDKEKYFLQVQQEPLVIRTFIDGGPARSIAVGLPGGLNYCFNAESCEVAFAWLGMFLDVGPDRGYGVDRGGGWSKILGDRFEVGAGAGGLRLAHDDAPAASTPAQFLGYRKSSRPEFFFDLQGTRVTQIIEPLQEKDSTPSGMMYRFKTQGGASRDLVFRMNKSKTPLEVSSSAGKWQGDSLLISAQQSSEFTITLKLKPSSAAPHAH